MESSVSNIVNRLGAGSGIDMVQLAADLAEARFAAQRDRLEARNETLDARISAASLLRSQLLDLASALGDRIRNGDLAPSPILGNPAIADVSVLAGTSASGSYSLEVTQLAREQVIASKSYASADDLVGAGTLRLRFGTVSGVSFSEDSARAPLEIAIDSTDTLASLASKINAASGGGLSAYVATGTGGAQLVIKGAQGAANGFVIEGVSSAATPTNAPGDLSYLSWNPASDAGELRQGALDALFKFDTIEMQSASNTVSGLPENITLTLKATNIGAPTTIGFADNSAKLAGVMGDFVSALNEIASQLAQSAAPLGGELGADAGARALKRALSGLPGLIIMPNASPGEPATLGDLGLSINRDGTFRLDSERLNRTLGDHPEAASAMFTTGLFGVYASIDTLARARTARGDPGSLGGSIERYNAQIERNNEKLEKIAEQQQSLRERLTKNFVAAEQRIALSQSTLSFVQQQIDVWTNSNS